MTQPTMIVARQWEAIHDGMRTREFTFPFVPNLRRERAGRRLLSWTRIPKITKVFDQMRATDRWKRTLCSGELDELHYRVEPP
jgi:hypothetical protein